MGRRLPEPRAAVLRGYRRIESLLGYVVILEDPESSVEGLVWEIGDADLSFADHYEGYDADPPFYVRRTVTVEMDGGTATAEVYVGNPKIFRQRDGSR